MYLPFQFKNEDESRSLEIIAAHPFATLISISPSEEAGLFVSHLPLVIESSETGLILLGHLAKANPHWKFLQGTKVTAIFHGPNAYITPKWYAENDVPTWNYSVVHVRGRVELIEDREAIVDCLKKLTAHVEAGASEPWKFWIPDGLSSEEDLCSVIIGFRIVVDEVKAKFKLSQNRSEEDQRRVVNGLNARSDQMSQDVAKLMERVRGRIFKPAP
jgi:transcriptional regulator